MLVGQVGDACTTDTLEIIQKQIVITVASGASLGNCIAEQNYTIGFPGEAGDGKVIHYFTL
jgi:hypothetical protein